MPRWVDFIMDNPVSEFVAPRGVRNQLEATVNPLESMRINQARLDMLAPFMPFLPAPLNTAGTALTQGLGSNSPFMPANMFDVRPGSPISKVPGVRSGPSANKRASAPARSGPSTSTENMTSQQVQNRQEVQSRPTNAGGNTVGSGPSRSSTTTVQKNRRAMQEHPTELARARAQGSPQIENLTAAMLEGQIDPEFALARGWITEQKYQLMQRMRQRMGTGNQAPQTQTSAVGPVGTTPAQASPGQRQQMQPQTTGTRVTGNQQDIQMGQPRAQQPRQPTSDTPPTELHQQDIQRHMQNLESQELIAPGTQSGDVPQLAWQTSVEQLAPLPKPDVGSMQGTGITLSPTEMETLESDPAQGMATIITRIGIPSSDPVANWMTDSQNAASIQAQFFLLTTEPGKLATDAAAMPDFVLDRYQKLHSGDHSQEKQIYQEHVQEMFANPQSELAQMINNAENPAATLWNTVYQPMLSLSATTPDFVYQNVAGSIERADTEWKAAQGNGYQGTLLDFIAASGGAYNINATGR